MSKMMTAKCIHGFVWYRGCGSCFDHHTFEEQVTLYRARRSPQYVKDRDEVLEIFNGLVFTQTHRFESLDK